MKEFTFIEIAAWEKYEKVRLSGQYNMFDPRARVMAGLTTEEYTFVMKNFSALAEAAKEFN